MIVSKRMHEKTQVALAAVFINLLLPRGRRLHVLSGPPSESQFTVSYPAKRERASGQWSASYWVNYCFLLLFVNGCQLMKHCYGLGPEIASDCVDHPFELDMYEQGDRDGLPTIIINHHHHRSGPGSRGGHPRQGGIGHTCLVSAPLTIR